jgi:hypothetical protein
VGVEGEVAAIKGSTALDERPKLPETRANHASTAFPKEPVMHQQEVGLPFHGGEDSGLARVYSDSQTLDFRRPGDLKAVLSQSVIRKTFYIKVFLEILEQRF